jgi:hypothetical protein
MNLVPLAALLLEYPVAYVPDDLSSNPSGFLDGIELDVYSCAMKWEEAEQTPGSTKTHTFMQFSCPRSMKEEIGDIANDLRERFTTRFISAGLQCELIVSHRTECLDRVAL